MRLEIRKVKPAIYAFAADTTPNDPEIKRHLRWGWVDLRELAEIVQLPPVELIEKFSELGGQKWRRSNSYLASVDLISPEEHKGQPFRFLKSVDSLTARPHVFVPSGWALAVIAEVEKCEKSRRLAETASSKT